ncbi:MAG: glycosyltransferase family 9 protein [Syntrophales bacterium]|nr:glycosyltransferase family 9 protein [Syntrophales bacterium]
MKKMLLSDRYESVELKVRILLFVVDIVGGFVFSVARLFNGGSGKYEPEKVKNIIIFRLDGLGDLVLSTAALREIRKGFPRAKITLVIGPWTAGIVDRIPFYDRLIVHDCFLFSVFRGNRRLRFREEVDFIRTLRRDKYDLGIDLRGDLLSIIPLFLSAASFRFAKGTRGGGFLLTHVVKSKKGECKHAKDETLRLVEALGVAVEERETALNIPENDMKYIEEYLGEKGIKQADFVISIAPCALYYWRSWPPEKFARVAALLAESYNCVVVLVGSREDRNVLDKISCLAGSKIINSSGDLTLSQVAALIKRSVLFIGNDSGLTHIAAAVKAPMIQLFGPGEPEKFGYRGDKNIVLMKTVCPYHPCSQRSCKYQDHWCMEHISVEDVMGAFQKLSLPGFLHK